MRLLKETLFVQQPRLLLKSIAIFSNAIFRSSGIKTFNITHETCNVKSYIKIKRETCWGRLAIVSRQNPHGHLLSPAAPTVGERKKARKLMGRGKNSLTWGDREGGSDANDIPSPFPSQCISNGRPRSQRSHSFLQLYFYWLLNMLLYGMNNPFDQSRSVVLAVSSPNLLPIPSLLTKGQSDKKRRHWCCASSTSKFTWKHITTQKIPLRTKSKHFSAQFQHLFL